jgi:hypothetical protein
MKKLLLVLFGFLVITGTGYAQSSSELKGPKAKNTKPWKQNENKTKIFLVGGQQERTIGPRAKNQRNIEEESQVVIAQPEMMAPSNRIGTTGPNAKNYKPGRN